MKRTRILEIEIHRRGKLNKKECKEILYKQLCLDYNCTKDQIASMNNEFVEYVALDGRRRFRECESVLKILCINGKIVCSATKNLLPKFRELLKDADGAWFSLYPNLKKVDDCLVSHGHTIADFHHFCLPLGVEAFSKEEQLRQRDGLQIQWFEKNELEQFRGDERFKNALSFDSNAPDMIAVAAFDQGEIVGMSGASMDSEMMWQIGIDVNPKCRGRNLGANLTILLKDKIMEKGIVPFYGTAESHIQSQTVEVKSGFIPTWAELYSTKIKM